MPSSSILTQMVDDTSFDSKWLYLMASGDYFFFNRILSWANENGYYLLLLSSMRKWKLSHLLHYKKNSKKNEKNKEPIGSLNSWIRYDTYFLWVGSKEIDNGLLGNENCRNGNLTQGTNRLAMRRWKTRTIKYLSSLKSFSCLKSLEENYVVFDKNYVVVNRNVWSGLCWSLALLCGMFHSNTKYCILLMNFAFYLFNFVLKRWNAKFCVLKGELNTIHSTRSLLSKTQIWQV